jgi:hypothetical protein
MIRSFTCLALVAILLSGCIAVNQAGRLGEGRPMLRHVVLLKFKGEATPADIRNVENAFAALPSKVDAIYDLEWGTDVSVENLQQGFTHCFFVSFRSEADRDEYLPHPAHEQFGNILRPHLDKVLVIDYWTKH